MDAVEKALQHIAREKEKGEDVRMVSFRQFVDWLDVQQPEVLARLRTLDVGQRPAGGWKEFLKDTGGGTGTQSAEGAPDAA
jgi:hypothetical protein